MKLAVALSSRDPSTFCMIILHRGLSVDAKSSASIQYVENAQTDPRSAASYLLYVSYLSFSRRNLSAVE